MALIKLLFAVSYVINCNAKIKIYCSTVSSPHNTPCIYSTDRNLKPCDNQPLPYDIIILNDISCPITEDQCELQQKMIGETVLALKGNSTSSTSEIDDIPDARIAYIEFDQIQTYTIVSLLHKYNQNPVTNDDLNTNQSSFYCKTTDQSSTCNFENNRLGNPNLELALDTAWEEFNNAHSFQLDRLQKIIIFSNCKTSDSNIPSICQNAQSYINNGVDILMVNNGPNFADNTPYLMCLVENDTNRIFANTNFNFFKWNNAETIPDIIGTDIGIRFKIQNETCSLPSVSPTYAPTSNPTPAPTDNPTPTPTDNPTRGPTINPTKYPTISPTKYPSTNPTKYPSTNPTKYPTINPTKYPTKWPSKWPTPSPIEYPTNDPTIKPTESPIMCACQKGTTLDLIFLINTACIANIECDNVMESIAELESAVKGVWSAPRIAIITFDGNGAYIKLNLNNSKYNSFSRRQIVSNDPNDKHGAKELYDVVRNISCNGNNNNPADQQTNTIAAIQAAFDMFTYEENVYLPSLSDTKIPMTGRGKKIALISACKNTYNTVQNVCDAYDESRERIIDTEIGDREVEFTVINLGTFNGNMDAEDTQGTQGGTYYNMGMGSAAGGAYQSCDITDGDIGRGYTFGVAGTYFEQVSINDIHSIKNEICEEPTVSPTKRPKRRLLTNEAGTGNAPCITLEITLETENLLPLNIKPDGASNIAVIGTAVGNNTGGRVNIPKPDDENLIWELGPGCSMDNNQYTDYYWPNDVWRTGELNLIIDEINSNTSFRGTIGLETPYSQVYVYELTEIPLYISSGCFGPTMNINGGIYMNGELINGTEVNKIINIGVETLIFEFENTVTLSPSTQYEIIFELVDKYPIGCSLKDFVISMNNNSRNINGRRLLQTSSGTEGNANPNACVLGTSLAQSPSMKSAVNAMCNNNLINREDLQAGLFQQYNSDAAVRDHLVKTGSISLYNSTTGEQTFSTPDFPDYGVKDPCIAIDEVNGRIYAIGGRLANGEAVNYIQGYQLNLDDLTQPGTILSSSFATSTYWKLDKPRYGSTCIYWKKDENDKYLIVIGGMARNSSEFQKTSSGTNDWYNDIRMFKILDWNDGKTYVYLDTNGPKEGQILLNKYLTGMKPIIEDYKLFLFGGKSTEKSSNYVQRINLNELAYFSKDIELVENKAFPMIDDNTTLNGTRCKMVMSGQSYDNYTIVDGPEGLNFNFVQLFCNKQLAPESINPTTTTRRLQSFSEYDMQRLKKVQKHDKRRLQEEKTQIYVRNYAYGLDGTWYNFSIPIEICYDNNEELKNAVEYYENIINSKPSGDKWIEYKHDISEQILNESLDTYRSWSNGFGAVNVSDLHILDVRYVKHTPSPTRKHKPPKYDTHPERRKARYWWTNLKNRNENKNDWIDEKFHFLDCDDNCNHKQ